ncbi:MAG: ribonuclease HII [Prevotellaceae bacterium]|jgi:ribonuclease HII|nr:ribonuclease HII [Prevotellaceae bacterium]
MLKINVLQNYLQAGRLEAGCDEAGRGSLAGPVYAAAVILPADFNHPELNDSKQLSEAKRNELRIYIEQYALCFAVAAASREEIDKLNILNASILAMHRALQALTSKPDFILVDGNRFKPYKDIPHRCVIRGDSTFTSIAAASILAKTYRDEYMMGIADEYPEYGWHENKGYATKIHREAVLRLGLSPHHRKTFNIKDMQLKLF